MMFYESRQSGAGIESNCLSQPCLPLVERPESLRFQLESASNVERVKGADAKSGTMFPGESDACIPKADGKIDFNPDAVGAVLFEVRPRS
jgi:hypothetical protein